MVLIMEKYKYTQEIEFNGIRTKGTFVKPWFLDHTKLNENQIIEVKMQHKYVGRPFMIAYDYFGDVNYDWVVINFSKNQVKELINWPAITDKVYVPVYKIVLSS
jgi:hypothetical protein